MVDEFNEDVSEEIGDVFFISANRGVLRPKGDAGRLYFLEVMMSDQQLLDWLEIETDYMEEILATIEDGYAEVEDPASLISGLEYEIAELRHALMAD